MATLDWSQCPTVESVPGRLSGAWVFRAVTRAADGNRAVVRFYRFDDLLRGRRGDYHADVNWVELRHVVDDKRRRRPRCFSDFARLPIAASVGATKTAPDWKALGRRECRMVLTVTWTGLAFFAVRRAWLQS
jgi:hypothetical protein